MNTRNDRYLGMMVVLVAWIMAAGLMYVLINADAPRRAELIGAPDRGFMSLWAGLGLTMLGFAGFLGLAQGDELMPGDRHRRWISFALGWTGYVFMLQVATVLPEPEKGGTVVVVLLFFTLVSLTWSRRSMMLLDGCGGNQSVLVVPLWAR